MSTNYSDVDIKDGEMYSPHRGKIHAFMDDYLNGKENGYPLCCILRFAFESALRDGKITPIYKAPAVRRGSIVRANDSVFVPCNIFHRKTHAWEDDF